MAVDSEASRQHGYPGDKRSGGRAPNPEKSNRVGFRFSFCEELVKQSEEHLDDMLLLICGKLPMLPPIGECDVADLTTSSVITVAASSGHEPLAPAIQTWSAMAQGMSVVPVQVRLQAGELRSKPD
jgi:hypothetical protein